MIELVALGTSSQVPTRQRNHNGYLLRLRGEGPPVDYLFDPGEGTQIQLARAGVSVEHVRRIFMTHFHGDHCLGLAGVIQLLSHASPDHEVHLHFPRSGRHFYERAVEASIYDRKVALSPLAVEGPGPLFEDEVVQVSAHKLSHGVPVYGYRLELKPPYGPFVFGFCMDTRPCAGARAIAQGADALICECTYTEAEAKEAKERGHMTAAGAARLAVEAGVGRLLLSHFSQRYPSNRPFLDDARPIHPRVTALSDLRTYGLKDDESDTERPG